uniref:RRM domain-containing protein n=1 Tax=Sinocyclocheilus rhinocerous TaxID=307959 RepID=A0A673GLZ8_9TELE
MSQPNDHGSSLLVSDLHPDVTEQLLHAIFSPFGPICSVRVCRNTITNRSRGYGFVTFEHRQHAENALEALNFLELMDMTVKVLSRDDERGFRDIYADETEPTESRGRRLANAVKSFFTTSLSSPGTWLGIGLFPFKSGAGYDDIKIIKDF